ncbi:S26 family signal peptidase [Micromonospora siamensis]|nr:S26 family signal peptidase [Micromonospora siamensis]
MAFVAVALGGTAGILLLRKRFLMATVSGFSMAPTLHPGDRLLVRRVPPAAGRPGDIVVVRPDARMAGPRPRPGWVIKRLVAAPGDPVPAGVPSSTGSHVPPGRMAILGDNPDASRDSRDYGLVAHDQFVGVVVRTLHRAPRSGALVVPEVPPTADRR